MKRPTLRKTVAAELYKALHNKMFWIAVGVGLVLCAMDLVECYQNIQHPIDYVIRCRADGYETHLGYYSMFICWLYMGNGTYGASLLCTVWPLLAAMAFGWSYNNERITGVYNQVVSRVGIRRYFLSKHIAVFISGGLAYSVPIVLDLLVMGLLYPAVGPPAVRDYHFLSGLALVSPWGFCFAMCAMSFLWGGATACICHCAGTYLRHGVMVVLVPYALYIVIDALLSAWNTAYPNTLFAQLSPRLLGAFVVEGNYGWLQFSYLILLTLGSFALGLWQVKRNELV